MKIGFLTDNYPHTDGQGPLIPGGIGSYTCRIAEELARRGHDVHVFTLASVARHRKFTQSGVTIWQCPVWSRRSEMELTHALIFTLRHGNQAMRLSQFTLAIAVRRAAIDGAFDLLEGPDLGAFGYLVRGMPYTRRYCVRLHSSKPHCGDPFYESDHPLRELERTNLSQASVITAPTTWVRDVAANKWCLDVRKMVVVGNPLQSLAESPLRPKATRCTAPVVMMFGRLGYEKGVDYLAATAGKLSVSVPGIKLRFVGPDQPWPGSGSGYDVIRRVARETGAENAVEIVGSLPQDQLRHMAQEATACVFPSRYETFGMALLEAMAWGVPCIASRIPPFQEIVEPAEDCLLVDPEDTLALSAMIMKLIRDPELMERLTVGGQHRARQYEVSRIVDALLPVWFN